MFDTDKTSSSHGMGDRYHWAWGLIDFGNGTFQGAAHGMAHLWKAGLWLYPTSKTQFIARIDTIFNGAKKLTQKDGSLEEAFPNEGSYCVTALVAFDLLRTIDLLHTEVDTAQVQRWRTIVAPMVNYLKIADETHALISNHLATAVAALLRWHQLTGDALAENKACELLDRILHHQSQEGWFREYEGADPGYQTLCTYYLADVHQLRPDMDLLEPLRCSIRFLWHFAHPDGSFGGLYGSRCTRFYYPAGVAALAAEIPEAAALNAFMLNSIAQQSVVTLSAMDEPNFMPMFNAYVWAAKIIENSRFKQDIGSVTPILPCLNNQPLRKFFPSAGIWIDRGTAHYTIVNSRKGGVVCHFRKDHPAMINAGVVIRDSADRYGSSHAYSGTAVEEKDNQLKITAAIVAMPKQLPTPFHFMLIRILSLTIFKLFGPREWVKRKLVKLLITRQKQWPIKNQRTITLCEAIKIDDKTELRMGDQAAVGIDKFVPIHMASQGYWQIQDEKEPQ